ncbi:DUF1254 domain-containing protein [Halieaceae bacterium IMCC14734]|uniref:DUF1254 domain-containing protein n=2 Tax=Candidatus Litorirhabdus singularis TaxID=2518993 RepID=A0ABT3TE14_9GAMM|nr:DUF1254 domain-containing protein [Candidatus Litorirhabdus singularis]
MLLALSACTSTGHTVDNLDGFFSPEGRTVTSASYPTDETSHQILKSQDNVGVNKFAHKPQLTPTDQQPVVRMNRDTYYSMAVVDVSNGATVTMPEVPEGKYISVQPVTEDHRIQPMFYGAGTFELFTHTGSHLYLVVRLDATFTEAEAAMLQGQMLVSAQSDNLFQAQPVNEDSFKAVENALKAKIPGITQRDGKDALVGMFTAPTDASDALFTQEKYEVGAAIGWGGAQQIDNIYEVSGNYPANICHQSTFTDPKNRAFWSITVYNKAGFMFNDLANLSSNTATPNADGTYTISFGCGADAPNNIETANDSGVFNLGIRHYQPSEMVSVEGFRVLPTVKAVK